MVPPLLVYHIQYRSLDDRPIRECQPIGSQLPNRGDTRDEPIFFCELCYSLSFVGNDEKWLAIVGAPPLGVECRDG
jgi:hypothetical protein